MCRTAFLYQLHIVFLSACESMHGFVHMECFMVRCLHSDLNILKCQHKQAGDIRMGVNKVWDLCPSFNRTWSYIKACHPTDSIDNFLLINVHCV